MSNNRGRLRPLHHSLVRTLDLALWPPLPHGATNLGYAQIDARKYGRVLRLRSGVFVMQAVNGSISSLPQHKAETYIQVVPLTVRLGGSISEDNAPYPQIDYSSVEGETGA